VAAALAVVAVAGCNLPADGEARRVEPSDVPYALLSPPGGPSATAPATSGPSAGGPAVAFTSDAGIVLVPRVSDGTGTLPMEQDLLDFLVAGPSDNERRDGLGSALPPSLRLVATALRDEVLTVDVTGSTAGAPADEVAVQAAQIVLTATSLPTVTAVVLVREGEPIPVPRADGVATTAPLTASTFQSLVSRAEEP
jgi:hypothetical protein